MKISLIKTCKSIFYDKKFLYGLFSLTLLTSGYSIILYIYSNFFELYQNVYMTNFAFLVYVITCILGAGYLSVFAHNQINGIVPLFPEWKSNLIKYFKIGFKGMLISYIYFFIGYSLLGIYSWLMNSIFGTGSLLISNNILKSRLILSYLDMIFTCLVCVVAFSIYCNQFKFKDAFNISLIFKIIFSNKYNIFKILALYIGIMLIISNVYIFVFEQISPHYKYFKIIMDIVLISLMTIFAPVLSVITINIFAQIYGSYKQKLQEEGKKW
jgi:hypothetical protein